MLPLGSLLIGAISQKIGAPDTMLAEGIIALIIAAVFPKFLRKDKADEMAREFEAEDAAIENS